jgi:hypothetical protein
MHHSRYDSSALGISSAVNDPGGQVIGTDKTQAHRSSEYSDERDMDAFWDAVKPPQEPLQRRWFLPLVVLLILASVPWYRPTGLVGHIYGGLPLWIWVTLGCSLLIAVLTCYVTLRSWRDDDDPPSTDNPDRSASR